MITVVIPVFNEEKNINHLVERLMRASQAWGTFELLFVDDGSTDRSLELLTEAASQHKVIKIVSFSRNFGHQLAVSAGLEHASGDAVAVIDGDLQDPPEEIINLLEKWKQGYKIVYAVRKKRKESAFKRICYALFYRLLKRVANIDIPLDAGDFSVIDRDVVDVINSMPESNRFIRGLRAWSGFSSISVDYERHGRAAGESKYNFRKLMHLAIDGVTGFSTFPLKFSTYLGFAITLMSFLIGIILIIAHFVTEIEVKGWTSMLIAIFFVAGIEMFVLGVLGEYIGRIYTEVQRRPKYIVKQRVGFLK